MRSAQTVGESTSPYLLTTVFALLEGEDFNGESSEDASDFLERLLSRLESEELKREPKAAQDTVVQKGFGGKSETSVSLAMMICSLLSESLRF